MIRSILTSSLLLTFGAIALPAAGQSGAFEITGVSGPLETNIRAHVSLPELDCEAGGYRLARNLPGIRQNIVRAGRALGYYQLSHVTRFERSEDCWVLRSDIEPGEPVRIGNININIASNQEFFEDPLSDLPIAPGDQLNQSDYEAIKTDLTSVAVENGFMDARYTQSELQLDLVQNTADIEIAFDPGERYRIGEVNVQDLDALSNEFLQRFMSIDEGDYYSSEDLLRVRNALSSSLYFNNVSVTPAITEAVDGRVPVNIAMDMRPRFMYAAGAGLTTDIGPRVRFDYENRYLNRSGHRFTGNIGISPVQQNIDMLYRIPLEDPANESLDFSGGFLAEDTDTFDYTTTKFSSTYSYINSWDWRQSFFLDIQHDESTISDVKTVTDLVIPGVSIARTRANDALYPTRGWRVYAEVKGAADSLLSSTSFTQLNVAGKFVRAFDGFRLLYRFDVGATEISNIESIPVSLRYFAGGDQTLRGYRYESLGPMNEAGDVIGGKHKFTTGLEVDFFVRPDWKLAAFVDTGNAFNNSDDMEFVTGAGVGVRWLSPVGPIRVDLASALSFDNKLRLHITMGPDL